MRSLEPLLAVPQQVQRSISVLRGRLETVGFILIHAAVGSEDYGAGGLVVGHVPGYGDHDDVAVEDGGGDLEDEKVVVYTC